MRIGINALYLVPGAVGGVETYCMCLLENLNGRQGEEVIVFVSRSAASRTAHLAERFRVVVLPFRAENRVVRYLWEQVALPLMCLWRGIDVLHSLSYVGPLLVHCRSVVTVHDANTHAFGEAMPFLRRVALKNFSKWAAARADLVITVSEFSRRHISDSYQIAASKIRAIHLGPGWRRSTLRRGGRAHEKPYIFAFAGGYPNKNIPRLLLAFGEVAKAIEHDLIMVGRLPPDISEVQLKEFPGSTRVKYLGYQHLEAVQRLLQSADLFVLPSTYEGFGLPVLEAQAAGVAVACSSAGSLPEVAGAGAVYFDPYDVKDMAAVIMRSCSDSALRQELVRSGAENLLRFSWEKTAAEHMAAYRELAAGEISVRVAAD